MASVLCPGLRTPGSSEHTRSSHLQGMHLNAVLYLLPGSPPWLQLCRPKVLTRHLRSPRLPALLFPSSSSDPFPPSFAGFCSLSFHEQRVSSLAPGQHIWTKGSSLGGRRHLPSPFPGPAPWLPEPGEGAGGCGRSRPAPSSGNELERWHIVGVKSKGFGSRQTRMQIPALKPASRLTLGKLLC